MNYYPKWTLTTILAILFFAIIVVVKLDLNLYTQAVIIAPTLLLSTLLSIILFHKNGFSVKNSDLYLTTFIGQTPVYLKKLNLSKWTSASILSFSRRMGSEDTDDFAPDALKHSNWSYTEKLFRLTFLNQNHTVKSTIVTVKSELEANLLLEFVLANTDLKHEVYSPNFRKK